MTIIKSFTILSILLVFGIASPAEADLSGRLNGNFYQKISSEENKFDVKSLLGNLKINNKIKLIESLDRLFPLFKIDEKARRYKIFDFWGVHGIKSRDVDPTPFISILDVNSNKYVEDEGPQILFELLQSKIKRTEIFLLFHLSFNPITDQMFLEMQLTPSSEKGIDLLLPF
jgi:hypothetical protein